jgi:hypothetical protein
MRINYRKIGGLHFIKLGTRYQLSFCRLRNKSPRYIQTRDDEWFYAEDIESRHAMRLDSLDPSMIERARVRYTRFLSSPAMREAREVEGVLMGIICLPVIFIWSVTLVELADRMNWF